MRSVLLNCLLALCLMQATTPPASAGTPADAAPLGPEAALACAAARYRGEALRIAPKEDGRVQELSWRTPAGNMLRIRLVAPGCRFVEVRGVGQAEARILPGDSP
jgi:hypothetical protein